MAESRKIGTRLTFTGGTEYLGTPLVVLRYMPETLFLSAEGIVAVPTVFAAGLA